MIRPVLLGEVKQCNRRAISQRLTQLAPARTDHPGRPLPRGIDVAAAHRDSWVLQVVHDPAPDPFRVPAMPRLRGVLLDIDGTLVDSNDAHARAWVEALAATGRAVAFEAVRPLIGMGGDKLLPRVCGIDAESPDGKRASDQRSAIFRSTYLPGLKPCRGAADLLAGLVARGLRLAVASSAKKDELGALLKICGADHLIEAAASSDDAAASKPDPDIVHAALAALGLPPEEVAFLGDTPYDVEAARRAGIRVIGLRCGGWREPDLAADEVYDDPADLLHRLDQSLLIR